MQLPCGEAENHNKIVGIIEKVKFSFLIVKSTSIMKKVKLMLLSFCVLAVVAGALAFKSKGTLEFCWNTPNPFSPFCGTIQNPKVCPNHTIIGKSHLTNRLCTAPTTGIAGSPCTNVICGTQSVLSTPVE